GWAFPPTLDDQGQVNMSLYESAVRQSIWMILSTAPGERLMRPDFGCSIQNQVFMPNSADITGRIVSDVQRSLIEWEPRIDVLSVDVSPEAAQPNCLLIQINYQVRTTNNRFNLVYPFYLE
ncbi:MAG: baseplate protein, partial [Phormidesmis priestleyi]